MAQGDWLYGEEFTSYTDERLVELWNDGEGSISYLQGLEAELGRRAYEPRSSDPDDGRERLGGERCRLTVKPGHEQRTTS